MKKRTKGCNRSKLPAIRATLRHNRIVVVHVEANGQERQGLIQWQKLSSVGNSRAMAHAICEYPHTWTIYLAVFCRSPLGESYMKSTEIAPQGQYRSDRLADVMEQHHAELYATCNPAHVVGQGWIASPVGDSLTEEQAARVFEAVGVWQEQEIAA